jgi:hypothetical protein
MQVNNKNGEKVRFIFLFRITIHFSNQLFEFSEFDT